MYVDKSRIKYISITAVLVAIAFVGGFLLSGFINKPVGAMGDGANAVAGETSTIPVWDNFEYDDVERLDNGILKKWEEWWNANNDFVGYLKIEGTNVEEPVMQSDDNDFYLYRNFNKQYYDLGSAFLDFRTYFYQTHDPDNYIIYGHMAKADVNMFGDLKNYRNLSFYQANPVINFDTIYNDGEWKIFSIYIINTLEEHGELFHYIDFITAENEDHFNWYTEELQRRSRIHTGVDVEYGDTLLTLSTCTYEIDDARLVIVARKVREGEDASVDTSKAYDRGAETLYPDEWYRKYGGEAPSYDSHTWTDNEGKVHDNVY